MLACCCRLPEGDGRRQAGRRRAAAGWSRSAGRAVEREPPSRRAPSRGYSNEVGGLLLAGTLPCLWLRPAPVPSVPLPAPCRHPPMHLATHACRRSSLLPAGYRRCTPPAARNRPKSHAGSRLGWENGDGEERRRAAADGCLALLGQGKEVIFCHFGFLGLRDIIGCLALLGCRWEIRNAENWPVLLIHVSVHCIFYFFMLDCGRAPCVAT